MALVFLTLFPYYWFGKGRFPVIIGSYYLAHLLTSVGSWSSKVEAVIELKELTSFYPCLSSLLLYPIC